MIKECLLEIEVILIENVVDISIKKIQPSILYP